MAEHDTAWKHRPMLPEEPPLETTWGQGSPAWASCWGGVVLIFKGHLIHSSGSARQCSPTQSRQLVNQISFRTLICPHTPVRLAPHLQKPSRPSRTVCVVLCPTQRFTTTINQVWKYIKCISSDVCRTHCGLNWLIQATSHRMWLSSVFHPHLQEMISAFATRAHGRQFEVNS